MALNMFKSQRSATPTERSSVAQSNSSEVVEPTLTVEVSQPPPLLPLVNMGSTPIYTTGFQMRIAIMRKASRQFNIEFRSIFRAFLDLLKSDVVFLRQFKHTINQYSKRPSDVTLFFTRVILSCIHSVRKSNVNPLSCESLQKIHTDHLCYVKSLCDDYHNNFNTAPPLLLNLKLHETFTNTPQCFDEDYVPTKPKANRRKTKTNKTLVANRPQMLDLDLLAHLDRTTSEYTINKADKTEKERLGLLFPEPWYKDQLLNDALISIHWEQIPQYIYILTQYEPKLTTQVEVHQYNEYTRKLMNVYKFPCYHIMTDSQADMVRDLFVYTFIQCSSIPFHKVHELNIDICNYKYADHPEIRMPQVPTSAFFSKKTRTNETPAILTYNSATGIPNTLFALMSQFRTKNHILSVQKIKSICKTALASGQDPTKILHDKCFIWSEKEIMKTHTCSDGHNKCWNLEQRDVEKLSWFLNFITPDMFYYGIHSDNEKNENIFCQNLRFYRLFRQLLVQLRDNIIEFANQYKLVYYLPTHLKVEYKQGLTNSFKSIMKTPQVQMMFMSGDSKHEITKAIYYKHIVQIKKRVFKLDHIVKAKHKRKLIKSRLRSNDRVAKREMQSFDCVFDKFTTQSSEPEHIFYKFTTQSGFFEPHPDVQRVKSSGNPAWFQIFASFICGYTATTMIMKYFPPYFNKLYRKFHEIRAAISGLIWVKKVTVPAQRIYHAINEIVYDTKDFFSTTESHLCEKTQIIYIELLATINIIYDMTTGSVNNALRHLSYFGITRSNLIKDIILSIPSLSKAPDNFYYEWQHKGDVYYLTLAQFEELETLQQFPDLPDNVYDNFARNLHTDEVQAGDTSAFATFLKPMSKLISLVTDGDMGERDIRDANALYQYMNHKGNFLQEQAELFKNIISFVSMFIFGYDPFCPEWLTFVTVVYKLMDFVEANHKLKDTLQTNKPLMEEIIQKQKEAVELRRDFRMSLVPATLREYFNRRFLLLEQMCNLSHAYLKGTHVRDTPVTVLFTGPPGVGKTTTMEYVRDSISDIMDLPRGPESMYVVNPDNQFHEGYAHQPYVFMDDMFKDSDITKRSIEATNIINMVNSAPFNMPMAFESKGTMFFDSQIIFCSTNIANEGYQKNVWQIGLTDPKAFLRRMHLILHRTDKWHKDGAKFNTFLVAKCEEFPEEEGKTISSPEVTILILKMRKAFSDRTTSLTYTKEVLQTHYPDFKELQKQYQTRGDAQRFSTTIDIAPVEEEVVYKGIVAEPPTVIVAPAETVVYETQDKTTKPPPTYEERFKAVQELDTSEYLKRVLKAKFERHDPDDVKVIAKIKYYTTIFFLLIALTTAASIWYFWKSDDTQAYEKRTRRSTRHRNQRTSANSAVNRVAAPMNVRTTTQSDDSNYMLSLTNNVSKGCVQFYAQAHDKLTGEYVFGSGSEALGFHFRDGIFFMPAHFVSKYDDYTDCDVKFVMKWAGSKIQIDMPPLYHITGEDACFFKLDNLKTLPRALKKYIWTKADLADIEPGTPMQLVGLTKSGQTNIKPLTKAFHTGPIEYKDTYGKKFKVNFCVNYFENTEKGESGSLVALAGRQGTVQIVGFHVCLRESNISKYGFALAFTQECLEDVISQVGLEDHLIVNQTQDRQSDIPFFPLYKVPADQAHFPPTASKLNPSSMFEWFGPTQTVPAKMRPFTNSKGELLDPLIISMGKLRTAHTPPTPLPSNIEEYLFREYPKPPEKPQLLTFEQCLKGIPSTNILSINVGTSAGYPYSLQRKRGKTAYIDINLNEFEYKEFFLQEVQDFDDQLRNGEQIPVIWADVLKDETRPLEKVDAGKTRLFSTCPLHYLILVRKYFGSLLSYIKSFASEKPICVGINVHSIEWENIYTQLRAKSGSIIAGDFQNWDGSIPKFVADVVIQFINNWYDDGPTNARVRQLLCQHMVEAVHICFDTVYQTCGSGPTGNPMTSEWNSLIQMVCNFVVLTQDLKLDPEDFVQKLYGDDNLMAILKPNIRCCDLAPFYKARFGMVYTHWTKAEADVQEHDTLETVSFIGRSFVVDNHGNVRAPLTLDTIVEMWYWAEGKGNDDLLMISIADSFFSELSHHPKRVFDEYSELCLKAVQERIPHLRNEILNRKLMYSTYLNRMYYGGRSTEEFKIQSKDYTLFEGTLFADTNSDTDRGLMDPSSTQKVDLGTFNDVAPVLDTIVNSQVTQEPYDTPNMETNDFNQSLDRVFNIGNPAWTTAQAAGTVIASYSFPQDLFNQTYISDKINDFRAFQGGIQVNVRITAARTLYGKLMLVYYPYRTYYPTGSLTLQTFTPATSIYQRSGNPHVLADASSSDVVTLTVPFTSPNRYLDLYKYGSSEMGYFQLVVMNPLTNTDATVSSAVVVVTAGFVGGKVFIPTDTSSGVTSLRARYREKVGNVQEKERLELEALTDEFRTSTQSSSYQDNRMENRGKLSAAKESASKNIEAVKKIQVPNAQNEVHKHLESGTSRLKLFGNTMANLAFNVAENVATTAMVTAIGLSKPTTLNTTTIVSNNPHFNMNNGKGIDTAMKLAIDNENQISTMPNVAGITADEMTLSFILSTPSMVTQTVWLPGSSPILIGTTGIDTNLSFVDHFKLQHVYWSGSHKFKLYITASIFHSVRFVFYMALGVSSDWQVCHHKVVEIQGPTEVDFLVPYYPQQVAAWISDTATPYSLYCKVLSWSQADMTLENPIYINTYKAAATDFQLACPRDVRYILQSNPREDFNVEFEPIHPSVSGYGQTNLLFGEKLDTIRLHLHKYSANSSQANTQTEYELVSISRVAGTAMLGLDMYGLFYRFWRGSVRYKFVYKKAATTFGSLYAKDTGNGYQGVAVSNPMINCVECEVPYYDGSLIEHTGMTNMITRRLVRNAGDVCYMFKAAGDDFSFHWLTLPPLGTYTQNTTQGNAGYIAF